MKKIVSAVMLILLLQGILSVSVNIHFVKGQGLSAESDESCIPVDGMLKIDRVIGNRQVEYWEHVINNLAYVKNDFVLVHTNPKTGQILKCEKRWREVEIKDEETKLFEPKEEYFWKKLVVFPEKEDCGYFYTLYDVQEYPFVCWEVRYADGTTKMYDSDGDEVGFGTPAPSEGFSLSGYNNPIWPDPWIGYRESANSWFVKWCDATTSISMPSPNIISSYVKDPECQYFYELAHGDSYSFRANDTDFYYSWDVTADMLNRLPIRFAFIGSCDGMLNTYPGTFSYEFRKGQLTRTTTIGYVGMDSCPGWSVSLEWQNYMFQKMDEGYTIKESFDLASAEYPTMAPCVRFVGDEELRVHGPNTITVPDDFLSIQEAINNANEGDTIFVRSGIYYEHVVINKTVSLLGENSETTIIDGSGVGTIVFLIASNVTFQNFTVQNTDFEGIWIVYSNGSSILNNFILNGTISLGDSKNNIIENNKINNGKISLLHSSGNKIRGNIITNSHVALSITASENNTFRENNLSDNYYNLILNTPFGESVSLQYFFQDIDTSNTIDGRPIYFFVNECNVTVPLDASYVGVINCTNIRIIDLNISNNGEGILAVSLTDSLIYNVTVTHNIYGIVLQDCSDNLIHKSNVEFNSFGIISLNSSNNIFFHNDFFSNIDQIPQFNSTNIWDNGYPSGGNYWSDYYGIDADGDGIGDSPYILDENNQDNYPLMHPWKMGDTNYDGYVNISDLMVVASALGTMLGEENWNLRADVKKDSVINVLDLILVAVRLGT